MPPLGGDAAESDRGAETGIVVSGASVPESGDVPFPASAALREFDAPLPLILSRRFRGRGRVRA